MNKENQAKAYWKENLKYLVILLLIWFMVSFGAGILFKDALDTIKLGGFTFTVMISILFFLKMNKYRKAQLA